MLWTDLNNVVDEEFPEKTLKLIDEFYDSIVEASQLSLRITIGAVMLKLGLTELELTDDDLYKIDSDWVTTDEETGKIFLNIPQPNGTPKEDA